MFDAFKNADAGQSFLDGLASEALFGADTAAAKPQKDEKAEKTERTNTAKELIELVEKQRADLFHDDRQDGYAVVATNGIRRTLKLRGRDFKRWMAGTYYATTGKAANNEGIQTALNVLESKAAFDGRMLSLSNRFAMVGSAIYVDVGDDKWSVIRVDSVGFLLQVTPPVLFRRYSHQQALSIPILGGQLSDIHRHLAIKSDDDKLLVEAWLVASFFPNVPRPIITFHGPQGASKTTTARILKALTDPSLTESVDLGKSPPDLAQVLDHHGVPCFDNLTSIPTWAADMLCRGVTGGAFSKRELYSDDSDIILSFKRPMIITGINIPTHAPDLLDRLLLIELERIQTEKRMDESTFWEKFNADKPSLFGALLSAVSGALKNLPTTKLDKMPRMADFARIACAYAEYAGIGSARMLDIIMAHTSRQTQEVLESDPLASAIHALILDRKKWTGTAVDLLALLNESVAIPKPDGWPKIANNLTRKLNVLNSTLLDSGISTRRHQDPSTRIKMITLSLDRVDKSSFASFASFGPLINNAFIPNDDRTMIVDEAETSFGKKPFVFNAPNDANDPNDVSATLSGDEAIVEVFL